MTFRVGQKVVYVGCQSTILDRLRRLFHPYRNPEKCIVYTVANVYVCEEGEQAIELLEFPSPADGYWNAGFIAQSFRPVVSRKTDISALKALLVPGAKIREDA